MSAPRPITASDDQLARRAGAGDTAAREELIARHLDLSRRLALRYRMRGEPVDDLVQVAALGLLKAVDRWDPARGAPFRTFAIPTILGELRRHFRNTSWLVRPPRGLQELCLKVDAARTSVSAATGRDATVRELASKVGHAPLDVERALLAWQGRYAESLDAPLAGEDGAATMIELFGAHDERLEQVELKLTLSDLSRALDARARKVLRLRYEWGLTQAEISERIGVSEMHVSRIIRAALERAAERAGALPAAA